MYGEKITPSRVFSDPVWTSERIVSAVEWSTKYPELVYVAYGPKQKANLNEPEGVVCVWNTKYKKESPEFVFTCPSPITSLALSPFAPNLVIGGTYSGQIVIWDNTSRKRTPVQRSKHGSKAHTHPIFCLDVIGSPNAHNLISISSDGRCCSWSLDMLAQPQENLDLIYPTDKRRSICVTSSSFPRGNVNKFMIGCEDGGVYQAQRHGDKKGINTIFGQSSGGSNVNLQTVLGGLSSGGGSFNSTASSSGKESLAHSGPVLGLSCHKAAGPLDFSELFLRFVFSFFFRGLKYATKIILGYPRTRKTTFPYPPQQIGR